MTTILIIEDEQPIRENMIDLLRLEGYTVQGACNGGYGVELAQQIVPDLIICDVMMPDIDGFAVLKMLREDLATSCIPFIFVTARSDRHAQRMGMQLGADDFITKPFTTPELLEAVQTRLRRQDEMVLRSSRMVEQARQHLFTMVSEQMQRPLESVDMVLDAITRQVRYLPPEDVETLLDTASFGSRRLKRLVNQMALFTRLDAGHVVGQIYQPVRLRDVWMVAVDRARSLVDDRDDVAVCFEEFDVDAVVLGDHEALQQAIMELVSNALLHSPRGSGITLRQQVNDGYVWLSVADRGPGMTHEEIDTALGSSGDSPTLGLKLARRIAEAHHGGLMIESAVGQGTVAALWLPQSQV